MAKKAAQKTKPLKAKAKAKSKIKETKAAAPTGMWKILEQKKAHIKEMEQARSEGRMHQGQGHGNNVFQANPKDTRFVKFAGPRRKVG